MEGGGGQLPGVALSLQPVLARRSGRVRRREAIPRGGVVGGGVSQGKPGIMVEAKGKSHEDVKEEELAGDKSSSTHSGKLRGGRTQGAVPRADGAQVDSPTPRHPSLLSHPVHSSPVPLSPGSPPLCFLLLLWGISESVILL